MPTRLLAEPGAFAALESSEPWAARLLMHRALQQLRGSPTVRALIQKLLAEHRPSFGVDALSELGHVTDAERDFSSLIDAQHLELAAKGADLGALLNFAGKLEKRAKKQHPSARAFVTTAWAAHVSVDDFASQMERALDRDLDLTDPDAAWAALADKLESSAKDLVGDGPAGGMVFYAYRKVKKPSAKVAGRVAVWLAGAGNHDCVVLRGKLAGQVVDFDHETGGGRVISKSFAAYLKSAKWGADE